MYIFINYEVIVGFVVMELLNREKKADNDDVYNRHRDDDGDDDDHNDDDVKHELFFQFERHFVNYHYYKN